MPPEQPRITPDPRPHGRGLFFGGSGHRVRRERPAARLTLLLAVGVVAAGCAAPTPDDHLRILAQRDAPGDRRLAALEALGPLRDWPAAEDAPRLLGDIAWSDRTPDDLRIAAIDRLLAADEARFRTELRSRITLVERWPVLQHLFDLAAERGWSDATPALVRSFARTSQVYADADRPERAALARLHPDRPLRDVLVATLTGAEHDTVLVEQAAAWTVLSRTEPPADLWSLLVALPPATPLVRDLQAAAEVLDVLPRDTEGVLWLMSVRGAEGGRWWQGAADAASTLLPEERAGLELRHLPLLQGVAELGAADRDALLDEVRSEIAAKGPQTTRTEFGALPGPASERLDAQADRLTWPDLLAIRTLLAALDDPAVVASLFAQADADHADTATEHGGVLRFASDRAGLVAETYEPVLQAHDRVFYSSPELIAAMYTAVAHYHFHAQDHDNADYAGPGGGDLGFADRLRPNALVLTFTDRDTLNADYYQPGGVVVDLGAIRRPR